MENIQYAEELVREYIIFRGFTDTLQAFERELSTDVGRNFQVDKIMKLVFSVYVPKYQSEKIISLLTFFKQCFSSSSDIIFFPTIVKLELSILRYYIVHALQTGRQDKVLEFFAANGNYLLQRREEWLPWFAVPYIKNPSLDPQFCAYFSKEWFEVLQLSFHNFLSEVFSGTRIPALLKISTEKNTVKHLKADIKQLNKKLSDLQALLETKEADILSLRRIQESSSLYSPLSELKDVGSNLVREGCNETNASNHYYTGGRNSESGRDANSSQDLTISKSDGSLISLNRLASLDAEVKDASQMSLSVLKHYGSV